MKIKSKSLISIILSIMMVISMIIVAIPANAAVVDNEPVGAGPYYLWYALNKDDPANIENKVEMTSSNGTIYEATITFNSKDWHRVLLNTSSTAANDSEAKVWTSSDIKYTVNSDISSQLSVAVREHSGFHMLEITPKTSSSLPVKFSYSSSNGLTISDGSAITETTTQPTTTQPTTEPTTTTPVSTTTYYYSYYDSSNDINKFVPMTEDTKNKGSYIIRVSTIDSSCAPLTNSNQFKISNAQSTDKDEANNILSSTGGKCVNWSNNFSESRVSTSKSLTGVTFSVGEEFHDLQITDIGSNTDFYIQYTPDGTSGLEGNIKVWSVTDYDGITDPTDPTEPTTTEPVETTVPPTTAPADLKGVSLSVSNTSVNVNEEFTLTATASPAGVTDVTYTFYKDAVVIAEGVTSNTYTTSLSTECEAVFTVEAKANGNTVKSNSVTVTASAVAQTHNLTVYFKCASAPAYKPYVSLDGATAVEMTQGTELGKNYAGTLKFYWYSYTFNNVNSANTHTLTFTSKKTKLNATITDNFANSEYYLAVDNLMTGTEVVDLTGLPVYVRNFFHTATNMVYSGVGTDKTLGFTNIDGTRWKMGTYIDSTNGATSFSIKSATTMQMLTAELTTVSETQQAILDVNLDGKVDIKDATLMQRALVS